MSPQNKEIWVRSWRDWDGGHWIVRSVFVPLLGAAIRFIPRVGQLMAPYTLLTQSLACGTAAVLLYGLMTYMYSLLRTPGRLLEERDELLALAEAKEAGTPEKRLEELFGPGLELVFHKQDYGQFRTPQNVHLHQFKIRINRSAKSILFQCRDPLEGAATANVYESAERLLAPRVQGNWAEVTFRDPDNARGALLSMELRSVTPLDLQEVVIRDNPMPTLNT